MSSGVPAEVPDRPEWLLRLEGAGLTLQPLLRPAAVQGQEEIVHGAEVVVNELGLQTGRSGDAPGGDGGIALVEHELFGRIEEDCAGLRSLGADPAVRGRGQMYIPPFTPMIWPVM